MGKATKRRTSRVCSSRKVAYVSFFLLAGTYTIHRSRSRESDPSVPLEIEGKEEGDGWAIAVSIMSDSPTTSSQAVGACTVLESARIARTKAKHGIALVPTGRDALPKRSLEILASCNIKAYEMPFPVRLEDVSDEHYREALHDKRQAGVGIKEFHKLNFWRLMNFTKIMVVDTDVFFNRNPDHIFKMKYGFIHTRGPGERMNGGFYVLQPETEVFDEMIKLILKEGAYRTDTGWYSSGGSGFAEATPQGFLYWYWQVHRERSHLIEHCVYNRMIGAPYWSMNWHTCDKLPFDITVMYHLAFCPPDIALNVTSHSGAGQYVQTFEKTVLNGERHKKPYGFTLDDVRLLQSLNENGFISPAISNECLYALEKYTRIQSRFLPLDTIMNLKYKSEKTKFVFVAHQLSESALFRAVAANARRLGVSVDAVLHSTSCMAVSVEMLRKSLVVGLDLSAVRCLLDGGRGDHVSSLVMALRESFPDHFLVFSMKHPLSRYVQKVLGVDTAEAASARSTRSSSLPDSNPLTESFGSMVKPSTSTGASTIAIEISNFDLTLVEERYAPSLMVLRHALHWGMEVVNAPLPLDAENPGRHPFSKTILPRCAADMRIFWVVAEKLESKVQELQKSGVNTKREIHNLKVAAKTISTLCQRSDKSNADCEKFFKSTRDIVGSSQQM